MPWCRQELLMGRAEDNRASAFRQPEQVSIEIQELFKRAQDEVFRESRNNISPETAVVKQRREKSQSNNLNTELDL